MSRPASASKRPYAYNEETRTATCRAWHRAEFNLLPEEAGPWYAGHQARCPGTPAPRQEADVLPRTR
ncbi:hypothetical protein GCM10017744_005200 [Streptomyces antimycoticus]|uniref:Uncharacterized protein n=1 Tax=Streptomyces antimycoticus TaxID=68175 RepID=A0A4D4KQ78_9ACTN|nr:hypothetical protein [Streptomyces antimycoticus]GDY48577.1 hypothetical protein SANT12839_094590 [Streptomyces antimycoticus]